MAYIRGLTVYKITFTSQRVKQVYPQKAFNDIGRNHQYLLQEENHHGCPNWFFACKYDPRSGYSVHSQLLSRSPYMPFITELYIGINKCVGCTDINIVIRLNRNHIRYFIRVYDIGNQCTRQYSQICYTVPFREAWWTQQTIPYQHKRICEIYHVTVWVFFHCVLLSSY